MDKNNLINEDTKTNENKNERSYIAFISYRHKPLDKEAAEQVQKRIENYSIPKELRGRAGGKKPGLVFRDEDELPASSSLTDSIYYALDHSEFLIVICTPDLPESKWCEAEIRYFLKSHDRDHVLAVLADGTPETSFSPYLLHDFDEAGNPVTDVEPLAANVAGENHTLNKKALGKECTRICAALIGCPFDALWQRERRAKARRRTALLLAALAILSVFLIVVLNRNAQIKARNKEIEAQNEEIEARNAQIEEQNATIEEQNASLETRLSTVLVDSGMTKLANHDIKGALGDALDALSGGDPGICDPRAEKLLSDALGAYKYFHVRNELVYRQTTNITGMTMSADETSLYLSDEVGTIRCLDPADFSLKWEYATGEPTHYVLSNGLSDRLIVKLAGSVLCLSASDGSVLWEYPQLRKNWFYCLSDDGSVMAVLDLDEKYGTFFAPVNAVFLDTSNGQEKGRCELSAKDQNGQFYQIKYLYTACTPKDYGADFSPDGTKFAISFLGDNPVENAEIKQKQPYLIIDLATFEKTVAGMKFGRDGYGYLDIHFGLEVDDAGSFLFDAQNVPSYTDIETIKAVKRGDSFERNLQTNDLTYGVYRGLVTPYEEGVIDLIYRTPPMLTKGDRAFIFADRTLYVFDKNENRLMNHYDMDSPILYAYWSDEETEEIAMALESGAVVSYDFGTEVFIENAGRFDLEQGDIAFLLPLNGGCWSDFEEGACLTVPKESRNELLRCRFYNDPHAEAPLPDDAYAHVSFLPDSDLSLLVPLRGGEGEYEAVLYDRKSGTELKRTVIADYNNSSHQLLDENRFIANGRVYSFDGTYEPLEGMEGVANTVRLQNGHLLTWSDCQTYDFENLTADDQPGEMYHYPMLWLDDRPMPGWDEVKDGLIYRISDNTTRINDAFSGEYYSTFPGINGLVVFYGRDSAYVNGEWESADHKRFSIFDISAQTLRRMENPYPESGSFDLVCATETPVFAIAYEDGTVCLCEPSSGSVTTLKKRFAPNELLSLCFSEKDAELLFLTSAGRLDIYDWKNEKLLFSETVPIFKDKIDYQIQINKMSSVDAPVEETLFSSLLNGGRAMTAQLSGEKLIFIDRTGWTVTGMVEDVAFTDMSNDRIYVQTWHYGYSRDGRNIVSFPIYSLEDLKEWAQDELK